ncbi:MAG: hypothetical protein WCV68_02645 [Candidatus Paceibacterota bacterium]|jgi:hypothetical protein
MKNKTNKKSGFSTLLIVILIGSAALTLALALSTGTVWSIRGSIDNRSSNQAKALVNACGEVALEALREDHNVTGTSTVTIGSYSCDYNIADNGGSNRTVVALGLVNGVTRRLTITTISFNPLVISSWQEI